MADVTVVIVNWNGGTLLARAVSHLQAQTVLPAAVLVVDNASSDDSLARLPAWEKLTVLRLASNVGFAAGNNHAIARCSSTFVALLNPDAFPAPDWLERLLEAASAYPEAASFGSRQLIEGEPSRLDGIGDTYHVSGTAWREAHGALQQPAHLVPRDIFAPCAAAALYRRAPLQKAGGFDENYFCYMEDVDLGFRLRLAGHTARYVPDAVVSHVGGASSGGGRSDFTVFHGHRNLVWTFVKNMPGALFWLLLPLHLLANAAALLVYAREGQAHTVLRAKWQAMKQLRRAWHQRQEIQSARTASVLAIWRALDKRLWPRPRKH